MVKGVSPEMVCGPHRAHDSTGPSDGSTNKRARKEYINLYTHTGRGSRLQGLEVLESENGVLGNFSIGALNMIYHHGLIEALARTVCETYAGVLGVCDKELTLPHPASTRWCRV